MKWLFSKDEMGVERYLYVLFWFFVTLAIIGSAMGPLALLFGW